MKYTISAAVLVAISLSSCGSVVRGTKEAVLIQSEPSGASVTTDIGLSCPKTPCSIEVPRNKAFTATGHLNGKTGAVKVEIVSTDRGNSAVAGNIIAGGLIGAAIDSKNGANKDHKPNPALIVLK
jgi:hypothetical protein